MNGERVSSFDAAETVEIFALDSGYLTRQQLDRLSKALAARQTTWRIVGGQLQFQSISEPGETIEVGVIPPAPRE